VTPGRWFILAVALGIFGGLYCGVALFSRSFSIRQYIDASYTREPARDIGSDAMAYTSHRVPSRVANEIAAEWEPVDRYVDGSGVYLRYSNDAVAVLPLADGSLILVEALRTAYPRYYPILGSHWQTRDVSGFRGGGPGAGNTAMS
jgi:hypothetical protein